MNDPSAPSKAVSIAIGALSTWGYVAGWLILLLGGFHHASHRYSKEITFVDGLLATVMAAVFFSMAAIGIAANFHPRRVKLPWHFFARVSVVLPPLYFAVFG